MIGWILFAYLAIGLYIYMKDTYDRFGVDAIGEELFTLMFWGPMYLANWIGHLFYLCQNQLTTYLHNRRVSKTKDESQDAEGR